MLQANRSFAVVQECSLSYDLLQLANVSRPVVQAECEEGSVLERCVLIAEEVQFSVQPRCSRQYHVSSRRQTVSERTIRERIALLAVASTNSCVSRSPDGMLRRNWIVRTVAPLPGQLMEWSAALNVEGQEFLRREYGAYHSQSEIEEGMFAAELIWVDTNHLVLRTTVKVDSMFASGALMAVEYCLLQSIDRAVRVSDLQGYPREFWPLVFPAEFA